MPGLQALGSQRMISEVQAGALLLVASLLLVVGQEPLVASLLFSDALVPSSVLCTSQ